MTTTCINTNKYFIPRLARSTLSKMTHTAVHTPFRAVSCVSWVAHQRKSHTSMRLVFLTSKTSWLWVRPSSLEPFHLTTRGLPPSHVFLLDGDVRFLALLVTGSLTPYAPSQPSTYPSLAHSSRKPSYWVRAQSRTAPSSPLSSPNRLSMNRHPTFSILLWKEVECDEAF